MKVTEKDVAYVAELAHLELSETESARMLRDLNNILEYIERLNELETTDVPPMTQAPAGGQSETPLRNDDLRPSLSHAEAMANAPATDGTYFKVPKVIER